MRITQKLLQAYKLRIKRKRLLWRAIRSRRALTAVAVRTGKIARDDILLFATMRNEAQRIPHFLKHYRALGVRHFLIVANDCTDQTVDLLQGQPDVSLWITQNSYRDARFGMDWTNWLLTRYGAGHWCVTVDADELLVYPHSDTRPLNELTQWLSAKGAPSMGAIMLDLYPEGPLSEATVDDDPTRALPFFDSLGYIWEYQPRFENISIRGGPRRRSFFVKTPERAPHLHKIPLVAWKRGYVYVSSMHVALPRRLNHAFDARLELPTGVLLHSKFLDGAIARAAEEKARGEHFTHKEHYDGYYDQIARDPTLKTKKSRRFEGPSSLIQAGLMVSGDWHRD
ncbi:glycosyltransferase family 2 protein [Albirhodobacter sp. R86504]|uniref:glycosyltransferase family 2 protein n=1 Tax=Albirhodobacter sp. R86504 TaxID=3093848 RepID=UPI0036719BFB